MLVLLSCKQDSKSPVIQKSPPSPLVHEKHTVAILPFAGTDSIFTRAMADSLQQKLNAQFVILGRQPLPAFAFYKPRQRYIADSLLVFLRQLNAARYEKIIGLLTKDISTRKDSIPNWGILGLGSCPGEACVISSFRAGKNKLSPADFMRRMVTLALHELGHTYGLKHCPEFNCLMKDAEGKMNLDDASDYCSKCRRYLAALGLTK